MVHSMIARPTGTVPCQVEPELFFAPSAAAQKAAAEACSHCPFWVECRLEGLERNEQGVWGGLSFNQRSRMGAKGREAEIKRMQNLLQQKRRASWTRAAS